MITHTDEILQSAVSTDTTAVPRYNLVRPDGTVVERNIALKLANAIAREGTPINKPLLDEFLAASGVTAGSATAYTLAQEGYELFDGAPVRFQLHTESGDGATLNINGTGAKPLVDMMGEPVAGGIPAGTWLTAMYSAAAGTYVLAGGEAVQALYGERYAVDDAVAYVKDVPGDALPYAEVGEVGGMTYKVNVGTEEAPVYELRSAAVTEVESVGRNHMVLARNIVDGTVNGLVINGNQGASSVVLNGTVTTDSAYRITTDIKLYAGTTYTASVIGTNEYDRLYIGDSSGVIVNYIQKNSPRTFTIAEDRVCYVQIVARSGSTYSNTEVCAQIERGDIATQYTPYVRNTLPIPEAVQSLDGYGWSVNADYYNYIDWENKRFVKRVERVDMGTLAWSHIAVSNVWSTGSLNGVCVGNVGLCDKYECIGTVDTHVQADKTLQNRGNIIYIKDTSITDASQITGTFLYALATPIITDISSLLPADNILPVEAGGTITAVNAHGYAVPTTITYQRNVLANRASTYALKKLRLALELLASIDYVDEAIKPLATSEAVTAAIAAAVKGLATTNDVSNAVKGLATTGNVTDAINTHKAESAAHDAASIVTDTTRQFVSAAEKAAWNEGTGGNAKVLSNTRITTDSTSITIDLPTGYNYFRIVLSEVATTDTSLGTVRCSLNASSLTSSGLQLGAGDSEGDAFVMSSELNDYVFSMLLYDDGTFGSVVMDIVRFSSTTQGTCRWATDGNGSDAAVSMAMYSFSASGGVTSMTISTLSGFYLRHGMGITVIGVK